MEINLGPHAPHSLDSFSSLCDHHCNATAVFEPLETLQPCCCFCCENMHVVKEMKSLKILMQASWVEMFEEISQYEADFNPDFELLCIMFAKGGPLIGFIRCVFYVCQNDAHTAKEKQAACSSIAFKYKYSCLKQ